ncbi:MAG: S8 family serine peptidase [Candidatus Zixiibacteriota bacterium]|nr:MAG: S8 family serine peptidase [candidate division Zixibacteria bacterium]
MRDSTILWLILSLFAVTGLNAAIIDESLQNELNQLPASNYVRALVTFEHQADIASLNQQLKLERATLAERNRRVILALQEAATETQPEVVSFLEGLKSQGLVKDYRMFWIANLFQVEATRAGIEAIASRQDLEALYSDFPIENIAPVKSDPQNTIESVEIGLERINAPAAWAQGWTGAGRVVMNIDTGVDGLHPALADRFRGDVNGNGFYEESWFDPYDTHWPFPQDGGSHGTHTMGTICGRSPTGDTVGVAIDAQWIAAAAIDRGGGIARTVADAILSFQWAVDPDGDPNTQDNPDACGNSWGLVTAHGYPPCDPTFWQVIDNLEAAGTVVIFSAGNEASSGLRRPADRGTTPYNCFSVGAVDGNNPNLPIAGFSSLGPSNCGPNGETVIKPEVVAPGVDVRSSVPNGGYSTMSGTSMASPHVTGAVAVIRGVNPDLDVDTIKEILMSTAHDLPLGNPNGEDNTFGHGIIDLYEACLVAQSGYGRLQGTVSDSVGAGIDNALVEIVNSTISARADENGYYIIGLPADTTYTVRASFFGYLPQEDTISVAPGDTATLDFTLTLAPSGNLHGYVVSAEDSTAIANASVEVADSPLDPVYTDTTGYYIFPAIPGGSTYLIRVRAPAFGIGEDSVFIPLGGNPELNFALDAFESFEYDDAGWVGEGVWEWGAPTSGPEAAYDGTNVWATILGGLYPNNADDGLVTRFYLIEDNNASMSIYHWYDMELGWDGGNVSISTDGGMTWELITPNSGYPDPHVVALDNDPGFSGTSGWAQAIFDLSNHTNQIVKFRFRFGSDGWGSRVGWYLDVFEVNGGILIEEGNPTIGYNPMSFDVQVQPGNTADRTLMISNNGDGYLIYSLTPFTDLLSSGGGAFTPAAHDANISDPDGGKHIIHEQDGDLFTVTYNGPKTDSPDGGSNPPMTTDFGGPDEFGYMWYDSNEPNGPVFSWVDISGIGQPLSFRNDQNQGPFGLGFTIPFYENSFNSIRICSNGWLSFTSTSITFSNNVIPLGNEPNNLIAAFWDDLDPSQGGTIYFYTDSLDTAIVQYDNVPRYGSSGFYTFQVILTADGNITYQYLSMSGFLNSATIGIENHNGTIGLQVAYNQYYVTDNLAVQFRFPNFWLQVDPTSGFAMGGETDNITVTFDATELDEGDYFGQITVASNDSINPTVIIPCTLTVSQIVGIDDEVRGNIPSSFALDQNYPNPFNSGTNISLALPAKSDVNLTIYDLLGREVRTLISGPLDAGYHTVTWNGDDKSGRSVASGIYFYRIEAGDFSMNRKMIMLK